MSYKTPQKMIIKEKQLNSKKKSVNKSEKKSNLCENQNQQEKNFKVNIKSQFLISEIKSLKRLKQSMQEIHVFTKQLIQHNHIKNIQIKNNNSINLIKKGLQDLQQKNIAQQEIQQIQSTKKIRNSFHIDKNVFKNNLITKQSQNNNILIRQKSLNSKNLDYKIALLDQKISSLKSRLILQCQFYRNYNCLSSNNGQEKYFFDQTQQKYIQKLTQLQKMIQQSENNVQNIQRKKKHGELYFLMHKEPFLDSKNKHNSNLKFQLNKFVKVGKRQNQKGLQKVSVNKYLESRNKVDCQLQSMRGLLFQFQKVQMQLDQRIQQGKKRTTQQYKQIEQKKRDNNRKNKSVPQKVQQCIKLTSKYYEFSFESFNQEILKYELKNIQKKIMQLKLKNELFQDSIKELEMYKLMSLLRDKLLENQDQNQWMEEEQNIQEEQWIDQGYRYESQMSKQKLDKIKENTFLLVLESRFLNKRLTVNEGINFYGLKKKQVQRVCLNEKANLNGKVNINTKNRFKLFHNKKWLVKCKSQCEKINQIAQIQKKNKVNIQNLKKTPKKINLTIKDAKNLDIIGQKLPTSSAQTNPETSKNIN